MATFKFGRRINIHWNGYDIVGPAGTVFSIPDQLYEEFNADIAPVEPTLQWIDTNEFGTLSSLNNKVYYQTSQPTGTSLTVGDLWIDSDAPIYAAATITATLPISYSLDSTYTTGTISIASAGTSTVGAVQLTDSTSSTSITTAATPNSVKIAYDLADAKVASVSGSGAISSSGGTAPTISIAAAGTATVGAVQLTDSTSSTSTTTAATPKSVKTAYDLAAANVASVTGSGAISSSGGTAPNISIASAGTSTVGAVQLTDSISSSSVTTAATPKSVRAASDAAQATALMLMGA